MASDSPRILFLMGEATGGIAGHVASLASGVAAAGHPVLVATTATSAAALPADTPNVRPLWPGAGGSFAAVRRAVRDADIVHAHGHQAGALAVLAATRAARPKVVITWHNALLAGGLRRAAGALLERFQVAGADLMTGASSDLVERARALGAASAQLSAVAAPELTPWAGDRAGLRAQLCADLDLPPAASWVLTVSRIAAQKDLPVLVEAAAELGRRHDVVWLVVGGGDPALTEHLRTRIHQRDAPVRLIGPRRDVPRLLAAADVFALPSLWEARALVVQEALAAGLPCVVTDTGGLPDLVGEAGLLVPVGDPDALEAAVASILADPAVASELSARARARAADLPDADEVVSQWLHRYERLRSV